MVMRTIWRVVLSTVLSAFALPAFAQNYPAPKEGTFIAKDFRFHTGEVMPQVRLHYRTIGEPSGQPVLILHGTQDGTFPVALAHALHKASPRSELHLQDCGHNDCPPQWELVLSFPPRKGVSSRLVMGETP